MLTGDRVRAITVNYQSVCRLGGGGLFERTVWGENLVYTYNILPCEENVHAWGKDR
jgi:hypothetical protein